MKADQYMPIAHSCPRCLKRALLRPGQRMAVHAEHPMAAQNGRADATSCWHTICEDDDCEHAEHGEFIG